MKLWISLWFNFSTLSSCFLKNNKEAKKPVNKNNDVINNPNIVYLNYYQRNKEKILERRKEYVKNNYEKVLEQNRKYYNKEYFRNYYHKKKPVEVSSTQST